MGAAARQRGKTMQMKFILAALLLVGIPTPAATPQTAQPGSASLPAGNASLPFGSASKPYPAAGTIIQDCPACPELVVVPAGSFSMGSSADEQGRTAQEGPRHQVNISRPFAIGKYELTFDEYDACVAERVCRTLADSGWGRGRRPAGGMNWSDVQSYVRWISGRTGEPYFVPTEAEWEYVARAGTDTAWNTGDAIISDDANFLNVFAKTVPVGSYPANAFGLHDVHGNVGEWVRDCADTGYIGVPADGSAHIATCGSAYIVRGGGFQHAAVDLRSASRAPLDQKTSVADVGFRIARAVGGPLVRSVIGFEYDPQSLGVTVVKAVSSGLPASQAGLAPGDRVLAVDGRNLATAGLVSEVARKPVGSNIVLTVERGGRTLSLPMTTVSEEAATTAVLNAEAVVRQAARDDQARQAAAIESTLSPTALDIRNRLNAARVDFRIGDVALISGASQPTCRYSPIEALGGRTIQAYVGDMFRTIGMASTRYDETSPNIISGVVEDATLDSFAGVWKFRLKLTSNHSRNGYKVSFSQKFDAGFLGAGTKGCTNGELFLAAAAEGLLAKAVSDPQFASLLGGN